MASNLAAVLHSVVNWRVAQLEDRPLGHLMAVVDDMVIPTTETQRPDESGVRVSFTVHARHELVGVHRLGLPEWLEAHRAGDQRVVAVLVACDYTLPFSWCWEQAKPAGPEDPVLMRITMLTLRDGQGAAVLQRETGRPRALDLPPPPSAPWLHALHTKCIRYLSHEPPTVIVGDSSRLDRS